MTKKTIAVLIDWYLPGNKAGGPVKSVYSLVNLLRDEFNFYIITSNTDLGSKIPYKNSEANKWVKHNEIPVYYFSKEQLKPQNLSSVLNRLNPDIIYLNSFWSYYFSLLPLRLKKSGKIKADIVLAPRGMLGKGALSIKPLKKKLFLSIIKFINLHSKTTFHATTRDEEKEIKVFFKKANIKIASNVNSTQLITNRTITKEPGVLKLFYLSRIAKVKNLHFALEILNSVKTPGKIVFDIYGSMEDKAYWKECELIIKKLPANITVNYKGDLSFEQVQPTIINYHFLFLPTLNENFGHSIYETMMSSCPVIISDATPWNDINNSDCGYAISLKNKKEFITIIEKAILMDGKAYEQLSKNCITFMKKRQDDKTQRDSYLNLFS